MRSLEGALSSSCQPSCIWAWTRAPPILPPAPHSFPRRSRPAGRDAPMRMERKVSRFAPCSSSAFSEARSARSYCSIRRRASSRASSPFSSCSQRQCSPGAVFSGSLETSTSISAGLALEFAQFLISIYGGYFGGGIGFLMVAALTMAGQSVRIASATKNVLAGVMNASAVMIFVFSPDLHWSAAVVTSIGATIGGIAGARMLQHVDEKILRVVVIVIGIALTIGLFEQAI